MNSIPGMAKKKGYHRLALPSGQTIEGPLVVVEDAMGRIIGWHLLCGEEPMVEWIGGTRTTDNITSST